MSSTKLRKRKYEEENRGFNAESEEEYLFTRQENTSLCLIYQKLLSQNKRCNVKRHY